MKNAKCTNCGAEINVDESKEAGICPYCQSAYVTEKAINNFSSTINNNSTTTAQTIVNNYYVTQAQPAQPVQQKPKIIIPEPRPRINWFLAAVGLVFYIFPGVIYIAYKVGRQIAWDKKYKTK